MLKSAGLEALPMNAETIMIGSELLLGQIIDTNSSYLAQELSKIGVNLFYKTTVGDNLQRMVEVLGRALERSDVVITSGGLGPTEDDLTRDAVSQVMGEPLKFRQELFDQIEGLFQRHGFTMSENNRKQAFIPRNSVAIENPVGTAPGFVAEIDGRYIISLPGVPRELKFLMKDFVIPYLREKFSLGEVTIASRVLKICGMGESRVDERIGDLLRESSNPTVGILAEAAQILLRITAKAESAAEAHSKIGRMESEIRRRLGVLIFGADHETLEGVVNALLLEQRKTLALLETHSGGGIAQRFISLTPNALKQAFVSNDAEALRHFAASGPVSGSDGKCNQRTNCVTLADRIRIQAGAAIGLAVLGIAPGSDLLGPDERASGKTCIGVASGEDAASWEFRFWGTDPINQTRSTVVGIEMLRRYLIGYQDPEHPARIQPRQ